MSAEELLDRFLGSAKPGSQFNWREMRDKLHAEHEKAANERDGVLCLDLYLILQRALNVLNANRRMAIFRVVLSVIILVIGGSSPLAATERTHANTKNYSILSMLQTCQKVYQTTTNRALHQRLNGSTRYSNCSDLRTLKLVDPR